MATNKKLATNIDNSDLANFPDGRIRDNSGAGDGTPVNRLIYGDLHEFFAKLMRDAGLVYNGLPDSVTNGYQLVDALIAQATKNDYVYALNTVGSVMQIALMLDTMKSGEQLICLSAFDYSTETTIKGSTTLVLAATVPSNFKSGDYLRMIRTSTGVTLVRLADALNINRLVADYNFLKAATTLEEITGSTNSKATTPANNLIAFEDRVNGSSSGAFLASTSRNGLLSAADKSIINNLVNPVKNIGWFSGVDPGGGTVGQNLAHSGDVASAVIQYKNPNEIVITVTMAHPMNNINYFVRSMLQSEGDVFTDNDVCCPVFKPLSTTQFTWSLREVGTPTSTQSLKVHVEVFQLS